MYSRTGADNVAGAEDDLERLYLDTARVEGFDNRVFSIGPFGRRVSFAAQQRRALNTIWALERANILQSGKRVAVIGGGLAGVMAACALVVRKCSVYLYERNGRVLSLQQQSTHRYLHPTVNLWPEVTFEDDMEMFPTTEFPFLDWHADQSSQVIDRLHQEWSRYFKRRVTRVYRKSIVSALDFQADGIILKATSDDAEPDTAPSTSAPFDIVILAMGFGRERQVAGIDSKLYWEFDDLAEGEGIGRTPLVSGIGDGGLIESLRAVHTRFDRGRFCVHVAQTMNDSHLPVMIKTLEDRVTIGRPEDAAEAYAAGYAAILEEATPLVVEMLDESLRKDTVAPVLLIGREAHPYSRTAAPIHKFMVTHAIARNLITYSQGELLDGPTLSIGGVPAALPDRPIIVRHGPDIKFDDLIPETAIESLRSRQTTLGDILRAVPYGGDHWHLIPEYPRQDPTDPAFATFRHPDAMRYVIEEFRLPLAIVKEDGKARYTVAPDLNRPEIESLTPRRLFGVPTTTGECRTMHVA